MIDILRKKISRLDDKLLKILGKRFDLVSRIGVFKQKEGTEVIDVNREEEVMKAAQAFAEKNNLDKEFVKRLYELIIQESRKIQG